MFTLSKESRSFHLALPLANPVFHVARAQFATLHIAICKNAIFTIVSILDLYYFSNRYENHMCCQVLPLFERWYKYDLENVVSIALHCNYILVFVKFSPQRGTILMHAETLLY